MLDEDLYKLDELAPNGQFTVGDEYPELNVGKLRRYLTENNLELDDLTEEEKYKIMST